jgi:glutathione transport system permease protein
MSVALGTPAIRSPIAEFWRRFRGKRAAIAAGCVRAAIVLVVVLAPWTTP